MPHHDFGAKGLAPTPQTLALLEPNGSSGLVDPLERIAIALERLNATQSAYWEAISKSIDRIAAKLDPPPSDIVGTAYIADRLGCTVTWVSETAREGKIPTNCVVPGTGNGKPWKFYRTRIDVWLASR